MLSIRGARSVRLRYCLCSVMLLTLGVFVRPGSFDEKRSSHFTCSARHSGLHHGMRLNICLKSEPLAKKISGVRTGVSLFRSQIR